MSRAVDADASEALARLRTLRSVDAASLRRLRRDLSRRLRERDARHVLAWAERVAPSGVPGARVVACEALEARPDALALVGPRALRRLGTGLSGWADVDVFAVTVAGRVWRAGGVGDAEVARWARSRDLWWRRAAAVATVPWNLRSRGGVGDPARTLAVVRLLLEDREDLVRKAVSWATRALAKRDPAAVRRFLRAHGARVPALVRRETTAVLETGRKRPPRKAARPGRSARYVRRP